MGNINDPDQKGNQYSDFQLVNDDKIEALGKFECYEDKNTGKFYLVFESNYAISNPEMAESAVTQLKKIESMRNSCKLVTQTVGKSKVLCFDNYSINLCFEYYNSNMATVIRTRVPGTKVPEAEVWGVVEDLVQYLMELRNFELHHGDLQPKNILFNKNKIVKVMCPLLYTTYENAYRLRLANDNYKSAFSPEELSVYEMRGAMGDIDQTKSDIFSLGICLLAYVRGIPFESFYNFPANRVEMDLVRKEISKLIQEDGFSEELFFFVNVCTKENPIERADLEFLSKIISKKQQKIKTNDKFYW